MNLVNLSDGQVMKTTPELEPHSLDFRTTSTGHLTHLSTSTLLHSGFSVQLGLEFANQQSHPRFRVDDWECLKERNVDKRKSLAKRKKKKLNSLTSVENPPPEKNFSKETTGIAIDNLSLALADGITRRALFNVWKEDQNPKRKTNVVLSLVKTTTDFDKYEDQQQLNFRKIVKNFCSFVKEKWMRCHRNEKFFSKSNDACLSGE
ncbi:hypothetical protein TNCV_536911 [Trichonephila clavipes]|nr:hypothetical protein TNCV_536911 [Trichonephila clavipes]